MVLFASTFLLHGLSSTRSNFRYVIGQHILVNVTITVLVLRDQYEYVVLQRGARSGFYVLVPGTWCKYLFCICVTWREQRSERNKTRTLKYRYQYQQYSNMSQGTVQSTKFIRCDTKDLIRFASCTSTSICICAASTRAITGTSTSIQQTWCLALDNYTKIGDYHWI